MYVWVEGVNREERAEEHEGRHDFLFSSLHSEYFRYPGGPNEPAVQHGFIIAKTSWK